MNHSFVAQENDTIIFSRRQQLVNIFGIFKNPQPNQSGLIQWSAE